MINFKKNILTFFLIAVNYISCNGSPFVVPNLQLISEFSRCNQAMFDAFGDSSKSPFILIKQIVTDISIFDGLDVDVQIFIISLSGTLKSSDINIPEVFCKNIEGGKKCKEELKVFGERKDEIADNAFKFHKQGENPLLKTKYYHLKHSFGWNYLDHISKNMKVLKKEQFKINDNKKVPDSVYKIFAHEVLVLEIPKSDEECMKYLKSLRELYLDNGYGKINIFGSELIQPVLQTPLSYCQNNYSKQIPVEDKSSNEASSSSSNEKILKPFEGRGIKD